MIGKAEGDNLLSFFHFNFYMLAMYLLFVLHILYMLYIFYYNHCTPPREVVWVLAPSTLCPWFY